MTDPEKRAKEKKKKTAPKSKTISRPRLTAKPKVIERPSIATVFKVTENPKTVVDTQAIRKIREKTEEEKENEKRIAEILDRFTKKGQELIFEVIHGNEVKEIKNVYRLQFPKSRKSGYSFGPIQLDIANNSKDENIKEIVKTVVEGIDDVTFKEKAKKISDPISREKKLPFTKQSLINLICTQKGKKNICIDIFKHEINQLIRSSAMTYRDKSMSILDVIDDLSIERIKKIDIDTEKFAKLYKDSTMGNFAKVFAGDVINQFGSVDKLYSYMNGEEVELYKGCRIRARCEKADIIDLVIYQQKTIQAENGYGYSLISRLNHAVKACVGNSKKDENAFFENAFKNREMSIEEAEFIIGKTGIAKNFTKSKKGFVDALADNVALSHIINRAVRKVIGNPNITDIDVMAAAFYTAYTQEICEAKNDENLTKYLRDVKGKPDVHVLIECALNYAKNNREHQPAIYSILEKLKLYNSEDIDKKKIQDFYNEKDKTKTAKDVVEEHITKAIHCNGCYHEPTCRCGIGGLMRDKYR